MSSTRAALLCIGIAIMYSTGGDCFRLYRITRQHKCSELSSTFNEYSHAFTNSWRSFQFSLNTARSAKKRCESVMNISQDKEVSESINEDRKKKVDKYYDAILYIEPQIGNYEKELHETLAEVHEKCSFWFLYLPMSTEFLESTDSRLAEAKKILEKMIGLTHEANGYATTAKNMECSFELVGQKVTEKERESDSSDANAAPTTPDSTSQTHSPKQPVPPEDGDKHKTHGDDKKHDHKKHGDEDGEDEDHEDEEEGEEEEAGDDE
ncbi:hypothetical protein DPX39_070075200 [Trypanosoma brucei equiperdum]|uniref:Uncharacterized protein n=1 Tax=Trypanosoma brucei equiperdum TaxID=630700 RepID=A0A3L6L3J2_9TRYP|nr:hypothetical protein DPX39_070075200 [Trypanosoma brucei equiperdum]